VALSLANSIDISFLSSKINIEKNIRWVGWCIFGIAKGSEEVALSLANSIDITALSSKIDKEEDIEKVELCVSNIAMVSEKVANEIINCLNSKLKYELQKRMPDLKIQALASV